jgi:hypothetical protein
MDSAVADITATDPSETIARGSADDAALLQSRLQQVANQRCNADRNSERNHCTCHRFLSCRSLGLCIAKTPFPGHDSLLNMTAPFIEHSSATWNFQSDRMLVPLSDAQSDLSNETPPNKTPPNQTCPTRVAQ